MRFILQGGKDSNLFVGFSMATNFPEMLNPASAHGIPQGC